MPQENIDLEDLEGIGPKTAQLLKSKGILSVKHLALFNPEELIELTDMTPDRVEKILRSARDIVFGSNRVSRATDLARTLRAL
ncbi:DUF4332 domain-containing protein [Vulcanisaeta sp. JCM 14467]|uniref:DUF4332 domain-containing protein n=1 Tax=Vulcanisaeta sp. JCM 14467 TaxID=1295370 RepID=UPI000A9085C4|nr:DUF4332 domain-containing protein [Vulcanisaeta sp. JCM 14467]